MKNYIQNPNQKVVITFDNNTTLARIYENNKVIAKGVATCSPEDEFDIKAGSELALTRALESMKSKHEWVVVNRKARVGDYIRVIYKGYPFGDYGEVLLVSELGGRGYVRINLTDHPKCKKYCDNMGGWINDYWVYAPWEYQVVEPAHKKPEFRKITRLPKVGDYVKILQSSRDYDSPKYMLKINEVISNDVDFVYGVSVLATDHPGLMKKYENNYNECPPYSHWNHMFNKLEFYEKV